MIRITCAQCAKEQEFMDGMAGLTVRCRGCGAWLALVAASAESAPTAITASLPPPAPAPQPKMAAVAAAPPAPSPERPTISNLAITDDPGWTLPPASEPVAKDKPTWTDLTTTAKGLVQLYCKQCGTINRVAMGTDGVRCRKCSRPLHFASAAASMPSILRESFAASAAPAGAFRRIFALLFDGVIFVAAGFVIGLLLHPLESRKGMVVSQCVTAVILVVQIILLTVRGQSIGKMVFRIRIVRADDGARAGFVRAVLLRQIVGGLLYQIPIAGFVLLLWSAVMLFTTWPQTMHDLIAGTIVVKE